MQQRTFTRTDILAIILVGCMALFVLRLFWLQVVRHDDYVQIAKQTQQRSFVMPAPRGEIYMMDNGKAVPVVLNQTVYTVIADPEIVKDSDKSKIIAALREVASGEMVSSAEELLDKNNSRYEVLARNITRSQAEKLKSKDFSGVGFQRGSIRSYPEGQLGAQLLGFVNHDGDGQYGVEQQLQDKLKGRDGLLQSVTDVRNVPLNVGKDNIRVEPQAGENIVLSVDRNIQSYAEEALKRGVEAAGATNGSVIVMRPDTGQVLAMADFPSFSPGEYYNVEDPSVFMSGTTLVLHEPASVIKSFTMAMGIDQGVISPQTVYQNTDCIAVADRTMCNALRGLGGQRTMQDVLSNSLNVGTITVGRLLGDSQSVNLKARQTMYDYLYEKFGFGKRTGIELAEAKGIVHRPDTGDGDEVRYSAMTFGQSMNLTMVQVASAFNSLVNGGNYYRPTVLAGSVDSEGRADLPDVQPVRRTVAESTSAQVTQMLVDARRSSWIGASDKPGYLIGGKTGTAETVAESGAYTTNETVATYLGFGGSESPEYVIMVRVAAPGKGLRLAGERHAAPIFTDLSNWMIDYMKLAPRR